MKMRDVMTPCPYKIAATDSLDEALKAMEFRGIRHLPVIEGDGVLGVLSERDVRLSQFVCNSTGFCPTVGEVCYQDPVVVQESDDLSEAARIMAEKRVDCVLIADNSGNLTGIFTTTDACRALHLALDKSS